MLCGNVLPSPEPEEVLDRPGIATVGSAELGLLPGQGEGGSKAVCATPTALTCAVSAGNKALLSVCLHNCQQSKHFISEDGKTSPFLGCGVHHGAVELPSHPIQHCDVIRADSRLQELPGDLQERR